MNEQLKAFKKTVKTHIPFVLKAREFLKFLYIQRIKGFSATSEPMFDPEALKIFTEKLIQSNEYLEYGSGGSTHLAAKLKKKFTVVESDPFFLNAVKEKIIADGLFDPRKQTYIHANVGLTGPYGWPIFFKKSKREKYAGYSDAPWEMHGESFSPDLILVDGRFRVSSALKTIKKLNGKTNWEILFDDYDGTYYHAIEEFANLERVVGRMAILKPKPDLDMQKLETAIQKYNVIGD